MKQDTFTTTTIDDILMELQADCSDANHKLLAVFLEENMRAAVKNFIDAIALMEKG